MESGQLAKSVLWLQASDRGKPLSGTSTECPVWDHVDMRIERAFEYGGTVRLYTGRANKAESQGVEYFQFLGMDSVSGKFRLIFSPEIKSLDEKTNRLVWWEAEDTPYRGTDRLGDDEWDARTICLDVSVAKQMFKDLFDNGKLTERSLVQMRSAWDPKPRY